MSHAWNAFRPRLSPFLASTRQRRRRGRWVEAGGWAGGDAACFIELLSI